MKSHIEKNLVPKKFRGFCSLRFPFLVAVFSLLVALPLCAQEETEHEDFWISLGGVAALYSPSSLSYGPSMAVAYGSGTSIGISAAWFFDVDWHMSVLELNLLLRFYFSGKNANSGMFAQIEGGAAVYFDVDEKVSFPARIGMANLGLGLGWRFLLGKNFFIEPIVRGGYPYIVGIGVYAGVRF